MINKVTLIGNMGNDPEIKRLENGSIVARLSVATEDAYKDKDGNWQKTTDWHNVIAWRDLAERAEKYLKKGMKVYVEGKISYRKYQDKDGAEKFITDIVANNIRSLEKSEKTEGSQFVPTEERPTPTEKPNKSEGDPTELPF